MKSYNNYDNKIIMLIIDFLILVYFYNIMKYFFNNLIILTLVISRVFFNL